MLRVGSRVKLQYYFGWVQFNISMFKLDLGLVMFSSILSIVFDYKAYGYVIADCVCAVIIGILIFFMNKAVLLHYNIQLVKIRK